MKNIFLVVNKEKLYAYVVSVLTIITLFFMSYILKNDLSVVEDTSANIESNVKIENNANEKV